MTTAQRLMQEGLEKGLVQAAKNLFAKGIDLETVRECIDLPLEQLVALQRQALAYAPSSGHRNLS